MAPIGVRRQETVEDLGASDIYLQNYGILFYKAVFVGFLDAGCSLKLFRTTFPVGR